jgi:outer membrane PBP1 activator LpoA protein
MRSLIVILLALSLDACSGTQCDTMRKAFDASQAAYYEAQLAGATEKLDKYQWTMNAARAAMEILCAPKGEVVP